MTVPDIDTLVPYEGNVKFDVKVSHRIDLLVQMRPLLDQANSTTDETILLEVAKECELAGLYSLASMYRKRAGIREPTKADAKKEYVSKAIGFIETKESVTSKDIRQFLGLTKHEFFPVLTGLRKSGKVVVIDLRWIPKSAMLF